MISASLRDTRLTTPLNYDMTQHVEQFITRWQASGVAERANYVSFLNELCDLLEMPRPDVTTTTTTPAVTARREKQPWPKTVPEQARAVRHALAARGGVTTPAELAQTFTRARPRRRRTPANARRARAGARSRAGSLRRLTYSQILRARIIMRYRRAPTK